MLFPTADGDSLNTQQNSTSVVVVARSIVQVKAVCDFMTNHLDSRSYVFRSHSTKIVDGRDYRPALPRGEIQSSATTPIKK